MKKLNNSDALTVILIVVSTVLLFLLLITNTVKNQYLDNWQKCLDTPVDTVIVHDTVEIYTTRYMPYEESPIAKSYSKTIDGFDINNEMLVRALYERLIARGYVNFKTDGKAEMIQAYHKALDDYGFHDHTFTHEVAMVFGLPKQSYQE